MLSKVLISGGGRCNVTNTIWKPAELVKNYPRGHKKLLKPFQEFNSSHTQEWFEHRGVRLKTEPDGRVFPTTDNSRSIANALEFEASKANVKVKIKHRVERITQHPTGWLLETSNGDIKSDVVVLTPGGSPKVWNMLETLGFTIVPPVPSLFTFHCTSPLLNDLAGISLPNAAVTLNGSKIVQHGPILITHEGVSGPAVLKLSAWAAREMHEKNYVFSIRVNWLSDIKQEDFIALIRKEQQENPKRYVAKNPLAGIPKRFWLRLCTLSNIPETRNYAEIGKKQIAKLCENVFNHILEVKGKSTNKDEFVTAGGVDLSEIDFSNFSAKRFNNLYLAGEVLNIDAVTGGFNFQAAWTGGYLIGNGIPD